MARVLEPTLVFIGTQQTVNGGGSVQEYDFDFGSLEGALIMAVEHRNTPGIGTTGELYAGLDLTPNASAAASAAAFLQNPNIVGMAVYEEIFTTSGANLAFTSQFVDLSDQQIVIARNPSASYFEVSGNNRGGLIAVYYKRVLFTADELSTVIAFRA